MSTIGLRSTDRSTLPPLLLPTLKSHCRVEFTRDDQYLIGVASRSIDLFERITGASIFTRVYDWEVAMEEGAYRGAAWRWAGPVIPFTGFTATVEAVDVASEYTIIPSVEIVGPSWLQRATGQPLSVPVLTATSGYATAEDLPPGVLDFVLRAGAWLYEFREQGMMSGVDMLAYGNALLAGQWIPRA